ncbi:MAG: hypothetical protein KC561_18645, partial [Myxococcales bacterium]|nr:hypothetical protein [Myxococcales bacterium]
MSEEQKSSAGLFRLKDLMEMEVDQEETFPTNNSELRPQHPPKPVPTPVAENVANTAMVEAIRAARSAGAPDTGEESLLTPGKLPAANLRLETRNLDALAKHAQVGTAPAAAGEYRTGEHQRVVAALQKDERRRGWKSVLLFVVIPAVLL